MSSKLLSSMKNKYIVKWKETELHAVAYCINLTYIYYASQLLTYIIHESYEKCTWLYPQDNRINNTIVNRLMHLNEKNKILQISWKWDNLIRVMCGEVICIGLKFKFKFANRWKMRCDGERVLYIRYIPHICICMWCGCDTSHEVALWKIIKYAKSRCKRLCGMNGNRERKCVKYCIWNNAKSDIVSLETDAFTELICTKSIIIH